MISSTFKFAIFAAALARQVLGDAVPTAPGPGDVFNEGTNCSFSWTPDSSANSAWKKMTVQLYTGPNKQQVKLMDVATLDGTDSDVTSFSFACPQVTPNAPIYFYVFNSVPASNAAFTTRFTIAGPNGETVPAPNKTQPEGDPIPWGFGMLVGTSTSSGANSNTSSSSTDTTSGADGSTGTTSSSSDSTTTTGTTKPSTSAPSTSGNQTSAASTAQNTTTTDGALRLTMLPVTIALPLISLLL